MPKPPPFTPPPIRRRFGPKLGLSLMVLGVAALLPGRLQGLGELILPLQAAEPPAPPPLPVPRPMALRDGLVAIPSVSPVLAGPIRPNPLGEERPGEGRLLSEVMRRQAEVDRRERELELREAQLLAAESLTRAQIAELTRLREEVEKLMIQESQAAVADLDALVALYMNMKAPQAAKVLERLDPPRSAAILLKIPERQAGPILASMEPPAALAVTQEIAGRREAFRP